MDFTSGASATFGRMEPLPAEPHTPALQLQPKVTAATLGGSLATIAIVVLENYGVTVTAELGAAIATVAAAVLGWAVKA